MKRLLALVGVILVTLVTVSFSAGGSPTDTTAEREKERQRILSQNLEADVVVAQAVLKLTQHKELDPMERAMLDRAVHDLQRNGQAYRRAIW